MMVLFLSCRFYFLIISRVVQFLCYERFSLT